MKEIFTIGYVSYQPEELAKVLLSFGVSCLIDVRSNPHSAYYTQYNREVFSETLKQYGIIYRNYAYEFGARQEDPRYFAKEGYLDFSKYTQSEQFQQGAQKIEQGIRMGYVFALMCAEKDPMTCHRAIMIGKALKEQDFNVKHIIYPNVIETQQEMEQRGIGDQLSFFSDEQRIEDFYREQNRKIGYRPDSGKEGVA
jgi:uncharacterized protein (DUF488 family)